MGGGEIQLFGADISGDCLRLRDAFPPVQLDCASEVNLWRCATSLQVHLSSLEMIYVSGMRLW